MNSKKYNLDRAANFLKNSKFQIVVVLLLFMVLLYLTSAVRLSNMPLLVDQTNGESIPVALDPFYFMRIAETYVENNGVMPAYDAKRYNPKYETGWHNELHPYIIANLFFFLSKFNPDLTIQYLYVISPVIFYILGLIFFFIVSYQLTKDKWQALLASAILSVVPAYLYRTMAGFADHESVGMAIFFFTLMVYLYSISNFGRKKDPLWKAGLLGIITGLSTLATISLWGGISRFIVIMFPISLFLIWIFNTRKRNLHFIYSYLIFYFLWLFTSIMASPLFKHNFAFVYNFFIGSEGLISIGVLAFAIIDSIIIITNPKWIQTKYSLLYSMGLSGIFGVIGLLFLGRNPFTFLIDVFNKLLVPIGYGRFGSTVAENQSPFLAQWISQSGDIIFWLFFFGTLLFGYQVISRIKDLKNRLILLGLYILMVVGIIFSKYAENSILNGDSFVSILFYFVPLIVFWIYFFIVYFKEDFKWSKVDSFFFAWMFFTLISGRAAARMFFAITPFVAFSASYFIMGCFREWQKSKDKTLKIAFAMLFIISLVFSFVAISQSYSAIAQTARMTGPSAHYQWQNAMAWTRANTPEGSVFVHWWDYGYWVESLGERKTVADGGHFQGSEDGNHKIGRYVLTTPNPETALSYFKSMKTNYLLIDPTELGKYSAYSRIGSNTEWDRFSIIPLGVKNPSYTQETKNETVYIYNVQGMVDEDINHNNNGTKIFLPGPTYSSDGTPSVKSYLGAVTLSTNGVQVNQPEGIFVYNNIQQRIPIRYLYINDRLYDFGKGIESVVYIFPSINQQQGGGIQLDPTGAMIYLSPKVAKSLYAQLYLLDDAFENYPTVKLVHTENSAVVSQIQTYNMTNSEFVYYNGLQGPIKIWETGYPDDTQEVPAFYEPLNGEFAGLDKYFE